MPSFLILPPVLLVHAKGNNTDEDRDSGCISPKIATHVSCRVSSQGKRTSKLGQQQEAAKTLRALSLVWLCTALRIRSHFSHRQWLGCMQRGPFLVWNAASIIRPTVSFAQTPPSI